MAQIKFVVEDDLADRFKRAVLRRRGKLALSDEGAKALRLYLAQPPAPDSTPEADPLLEAIGSATSKAGPRPSALKDKHALYGA
jgi:hypothetical protein